MSVATAMTSERDTRATCSAWSLHALDWAERAVLLSLYGWLIARVIGGFAIGGSVADLVLLPSEGMVVCFVLVRRFTTDVSRRPGEWLLAFAATVMPLLVQPDGNVPYRLSPLIGATVMLMGMIVQVHAKLVLGRSFGCVPANRGLRLSGPYRYLRHPMYAGYMLSHAAFLLVNPTLWNFGLYAMCYALQVPRLLAEERLLRRDPRYRQYMDAVRYRLLPGIF